jgi:hypothetical protein
MNKTLLSDKTLAPVRPLEGKPARFTEATSSFPAMKDKAAYSVRQRLPGVVGLRDFNNIGIFRRNNFWIATALSRA